MPAVYKIQNINHYFRLIIRSVPDKIITSKN